MMEMTPAQRKLWEYIKGCERCPSFDEMQDAMGLHSKSGVHRLVDNLERKGYIHCARRGGLRVHRGITINAKPRPDLAGYTVNELIDELRRRDPVDIRDNPTLSKNLVATSAIEQSMKTQVELAA